jgi:hypothetical protein
LNKQSIGNTTTSMCQSVARSSNHPVWVGSHPQFFSPEFADEPVSWEFVSVKQN